MIPYKVQNRLECGVDEAGAGSFAGNVFAAAVILPNDIMDYPEHIYIKDSKKLTKRRRLIMKDFIEENAIDFSIGEVSNEDIDKINIFNARISAMHQAIHGLNVDPEFLLIDGNAFKPVFVNDDLVPYECIKGGDNRFMSIAAASILAKVYHDQHIQDLCNKYEGLEEKYDLLNNMGYGTPKHLAGIRKYGITEIHRNSFSICKNMCVTELLKKKSIYKEI